MGEEPKAPAAPEPAKTEEKAPKAPEQADPGDESAKDDAPAPKADEERFDALRELRHAFGRDFVEKELADLPTAKLVKMAGEYKPRREKIAADFAKMKQGGYTPATGGSQSAGDGSPTSGAKSQAVNPADADDPEQTFSQLEEVDPDGASKARSVFLAERKKAEELRAAVETEATKAKVFKVQSVVERLKRDFPELDKDDVLRAVMQKADRKDPDRAAIESAMTGDDTELVELLRFAAESTIPKKQEPKVKAGGSVDVSSRQTVHRALTQDQKDELYYRASQEAGGNQAAADALLAKWLNN